MKLDDVVKKVAGELVSRHFVSMDGCGLVYRYSFRTHEFVTSTVVQDMLNERLTTQHELIVNILDFHHRESCEWWCGNILLCCLPLTACSAFDALSTKVCGPYYQIEVWRKLAERPVTTEACHART